MAKTAAQTVIKVTQKPAILRIHRNTELQATIAVIHAYIHNLIQPGTYAIELNSTLAAKGLPTIAAPDNPPSGNLMNMKLSDLFCEEDKDTAMQLQQQLLQQQQKATKK